MDYRLLKSTTAHVGIPFSPGLAMMHVYDNVAGERRLQVGNGRYAVEIPTDLPVMTVHAERFTAAWGACSTPPSADTTDTHVVIKERRVRARLPLTDPASYPVVAPNPPTAHATPGIAAMLARIEQYVATDSSRAWATSVCIHNGFAYATNNVILVRVPFNADVPGPFNLPHSVFDAIQERGEPVAVGVDEGAFTLHYEDTSWVRTTLIEGSWPTETIDQLLAGIEDDGWVELNKAVPDMLETAAKLADTRHPIVEFFDNGLRSTDGLFEAIDLNPVPTTGRVNANMAALALRNATLVKWHSPRQDVHSFRDGDLYGVFGGTR